MNVKGYIVAVNSSLEGLFDKLDNFGFDYEYEEIEISPIPSYIVVRVWHYPHEVRELEDIFAPYV